MERIIRGRTWNKSFSVYPSNEAYEESRPDNLYGYAVRAEIRTTCGSFILTLPITISDPAIGRITIDLSTTDTQALPLSRQPYVWDAVLTGPDGRDYLLQPMEPIQVIDQPTR